MLARVLLCDEGMIDFDGALKNSEVPDKRIRDRATLLFQTLLHG